MKSNSYMKSSNKKRLNWQDIDWKQCKIHLQTLQNNLVIAYKNNPYDVKTIKDIQSQILRSFSARALAVYKVTTNRGKNTAGIDGKLLRTSSQKMTAINSLKNFMKGYTPKPVKRVYIPKPYSIDKRPLGIPTIMDRCIQALILSSYDPIVETKADNRSFGFRKGRSCHDAIKYIQLLCGSMYGKRWILEIDIQKFFDKINKQWMIQNLSVPNKYISKLLDSGIIDQGKFLPSDAGVPQGGIISPTMANETLDGLENELSKSNGTYLARYADDFVVLGNTKKSVKESLLTVKEFLTKRGLEVHPEKTKIVHINNGFDFLGFNIKEYPDNAYKTGRKRGILLVQPSPKNITEVKRKISEIIRKYPNAKPGTLIRELNPILRGWSNYYRIGSSRTAFRNISKHTFTSLKNWVYRKHGRNKKRKHIRQYFKTIKTNTHTNNWTFYGTNERNEEITLFQIGNVTKKDYNMISISNPRNPYLIKDFDYFEMRTRAEFQTSPLVDHRSRKISKKQNGRCPICNEIFSHNDVLQLHHIKAVKDGGTNKLSNLALYHVHCHRQLHS